jgi:hypothetical protein
MSQKARSQNSRPHPEKRLGHKTRHPISTKGSVTKLATPTRKKGRSQNSPPQPEKSVGHKTRHPNPKQGSVTKLATPTRKKGRSQNSPPQPEKKGRSQNSPPQPEKKGRSQNSPPDHPRKRYLGPGIQSGHLHAKCKRETSYFLTHAARAVRAATIHRASEPSAARVQDCPWHERGTRRIVAADERKETQTTRQVQRCAAVMPCDSLGRMRAATT